MFKIQLNFGPLWDTCDFLILALEFTGKELGYVDLIRPPVMPFLTSIFFRLGYISENIIYAIDGFLFIFGAIGLYLLFNLRFGPFKSFLGCLLYSTFPIMLFYISIGLSDIPSVSFSIYAIYFTILAFNKDSKFFYLAFPFMIISFLTRYPMALIIFPLFFYMLIKRDQIKNSINLSKNLILGMILALLVILPFFIWSYVKFGNPLYPFIPSFNVTTGVSSVELFYYNPDTLYFLKKLPFLVGGVSFAIILTTVFMFIFYGIKSKFWLKLNLNNYIHDTSLKSNKIKVSMLIFLISLFVFTFGTIFYMLSEFIFLAICLLSYELLKNSKYNNLDIDLLFFSWFMTFFIFHSVHVIKDLRYFVTMAPAFSYFLILGLNSISTKFKLNFKGKNIAFQIISVFLIIGLLFSTTNALMDLKKGSTKDSEVKDIISLSAWLKNYDPNYKTKIIYSDYYPYSTWYLKTDIKIMPILKDNKEIYSPLKNLNLDREDFKQYEHKLQTNNADYYFCVNTKVHLSSYKIINKFGDVYIYQKCNDSVKY
ncbi:glycosyltransferase family 39 protein [Methanobacterium oryzae]|uniref:glycosyltransferase family 39 protein n=1 Tax=Methanobacterium oryzae TaxID=69540 RepID=UPI003D1F9AA5